MSYTFAADIGFAYEYTYDGNGNITSLRYGQQEIAYTYDSANQLVREDNSREKKTWVWTYDDAGNITSKKEYAYTTGTLGAVLDTIIYEYDDASWGDLLTKYDGKGITYDTIGNPLSDGTWIYTWEQGRQLASMSYASNTWLFTYDANGMRTSRKNQGTTYTYWYHGSQLSRMDYGNISMKFTYGADGNPISINYDGTTYYYVVNLQGDVVGILNASGTQVVGYVYDAWGRLIKTTGSMAPSLGLYNPLRYRGYVYDRETGLYYLESRYYNPTTGRFINADDFEYLGAGSSLTSYNLFAYCINNPVMGYDPSGHWDWGAFWDAVVTVGTGAASVYTGIVVTIVTGKPALGVAAGGATFGTLNNAVNFVYYSIISDGATNIEGDTEKSTYVDDYVSRWERLDYTKKQTGEQWYSPNAWRYHSEYSLHMYGWYATGWSEDKDIPCLSVWARKFKRADVDPASADSRFVVAVCSVLWGLIGL